MQFNGIIILLPIKNYLTILNLILTSILDTGTFYLFCLGICFSRESSIYEVLIILYNILFCFYWKIKHELFACIANFIPVIISFILILIMCFSSEREIFKKILFRLLFSIFVISIIFLYIPESFALNIVGIFIIITSISKILIPADDINSRLRNKDFNSSGIYIIIFGFICYIGWLLFGLIIGDLYCIISNGLISLVWIASILVYCWSRCFKKKEDNKDKKDKKDNVQIKSSETKLENKE